MFGRLSITSTFLPASVACLANTEPNKPAPTINSRTFSILYFLLLLTYKLSDELRNKELLQAIEHSSRSFEEIMDFLGTDDSQD